MTWERAIFPCYSEAVVALDALIQAGEDFQYLRHSGIEVYVWTDRADIKAVADRTESAIPPEPDDTEKNIVLGSHPRILALTNDIVQQKDPRHIDFKTELSQKLYKDVTVVKGRPTVSKYYAMYVEGGDPEFLHQVCQIDWTFVDDAYGWPKQVIMDLKWLLEDGSLYAFTKDIGYLVKRPDQRIREGVLRRQNMVESIEEPVITFYLLTQVGMPPYTAQQFSDAQAVGVTFKQLHLAATERFIDHGDTAILTDIQDDVTTTWLGADISLLPGNNGQATIRDFIIDALTV